jgi:hypothetical protein
MRTAGLTMLFLLLSAGKIFRVDEPIAISSSSTDKKIVFNFPLINPANPQTNRSQIDTAELKKGSWYRQVIKNIEESEYEIKYDEPTHNYVSPNRKQNLKAFYTSNQFALLPRNDSADKWKLKLELKGVYTGSRKLYSAAKNPVVTQNGNSVQFNHNNQFITEYINSKEGIRQNFIITRQPAGDPQNIKIALEANKGWFINKVAETEIHFAKSTGDGYDKKITYNSLKAWDANGKELEAAFAVNKNNVGINVNTSNAVYPITIDPLSTGSLGTPDWIGDDANQADAQFGYSVASAGDVNGDGYSDVIIGAYLYDDGPNINEGRAFVYHGSATGLSATPNSIPDDADQYGAYFGYSVACAGDVNGDGYSDVIIGAYHYWEVLHFDEGRAFVYYGSSTGLSATPDSTPDDADETNAWFGISVATAGDVNGDGYSDVIIGAVGVDGKAFIYYGSAAGLSDTPGISTVDGNGFSSFYGFSVACAGDVNGDGYSDIIIGTPGMNSGGDIPGEGVAFVYYGSSGGLSSISNIVLESANQEGADFGCSVAGAGDINGDGYSDVIIGARRYKDGSNTNEGRAFVYYGSAIGLSITPIILDNANQAEAYFGYSVACAGDVNGDGYSDVIIGAPYSDDGANTDEGRGFIYYGSSTGLSLTPNILLDDADQAIANFGIVASAGDVNGDGYSDIIIGAFQYDDAGNANEGRAFVYHGSPSGLKSTSNWQTSETQAGANYGISVASAGDVNSDGFSDVLVGAYIYDQGSGDEGKAYLYMGSATGLSVTAAWTAIGSIANEYFGRCVAPAGDVNGDGYSDVLIGAYGYSNGQSQEGRVYLFKGSAAGLSGTAAWTYENNTATSVLGVSVAAAGDVNGDGYGDIIIGAPQYSNGQADEGIAYLFYGSSTLPNSTADWSVEGNQAGAFYGVSVAGLGDVNGDGFCDVIVGANTYNNGFAGEGKAFAYYGSATGLPSAPNWTAKGNQTNAQFGNAVSSAGDINGDGYCDALVGAFSYDDGTTDEGAAFVYYGSSTGLSVTANWTTENNISNTLFGYSVCSAGDVNGDGYSDVLIGARNYSNGQADEGALYAYYGSPAGLPLSNSWFVESNIAGTLFGNCVASAGDVNGDGYGDVITGAPYYANPTFREGAAFVYYGNNNGSLRSNLRLYNQDLVTAIQQSSIAPALFGAGLYAKSPLGRQKGKLVWETEKNGQPFSGNPITNSTAFLSQQSSFTDLGLTGIELKNQVAKQFSSRVTYLRARVKYDLVTAITGQVYGPWRYPESFLRGNRDIGAVALPVKFISFVALKQNDDALLKWITTDETPGIEYQVQHSTDGIHFETIKIIDGLGNSHNEYEWLHNNPATGKNYYRIRAVENDKESFTATRQLYFDKVSRVIIYPNPAKSGSLLTIGLTNGTPAVPSYIQLFTINGQKIGGYLITPGSNNISVTLPELLAGQYVVKWVGEAGVIYSGSFMVIK